MKLRGFTLVEVVVVIFIVLLLSALLLFSQASAKDRALLADEIARQRQIYVAVNLYEADYDHASPGSIVDLVPGYVDRASLNSPYDVRNKISLPDWPANPWSNNPMAFTEAVYLRRFPVPNSYFYLGASTGYFPSGTSMSELRANPKVGIFAGMGLMKCSRCEGRDCYGSCDYWWKKYPSADLGQPAANLVGSMVVTRTDGSTTTRQVPDCGGAHAYQGIGTLFFFNPFCKKVVAVGGP